MAMASSASIAQKWVERTSAATQAYKDGIQRTDGNPMEKAAANAAGYLAGVQAAVSTGKWQRGLARVSREAWMAAAINLGANRIGPGVTQAKPKMQSFLDAFLPVLANNVAQVRAMPNNSYEARKARMNQMADLNHQFKRGQ